MGPRKVFDGAAPCGPALITPDEAGAADSLEIEPLLNGERMQWGTTADLIHSIPALVAFLSKLMTLEPGDVVSTGTPAGVGMAREPQVYLKPGRRDRRRLASARGSRRGSPDAGDRRPA